MIRQILGCFVMHWVEVISFAAFQGVRDWKKESNDGCSAWPDLEARFHEMNLIYHLKVLSLSLLFSIPKSSR
jgi:hypothetical protein